MGFYWRFDYVFRYPNTEDCMDEDKEAVSVNLLPLGGVLLLGLDS